MKFFFLGERLAVDLLNTVVVQDGRVHLLQGPMDVAAWAEAAGVLPHGALRGSAAAQEPERLRGFRETLRRGLMAWAVRGTHPRGLIALLNQHLARDPEVSEVTASRGKGGTPRRSRRRDGVSGSRRQRGWDGGLACAFVRDTSGWAPTVWACPSGSACRHGAALGAADWWAGCRRALGPATARTASCPSRTRTWIT